MLMESWPDDPEDGILASALRAMAFGRPVESYSDGTYILKRGDPFVGIYKLEEGCVEIESIEEIESESDEDEGEVLIILTSFLCDSPDSSSISLRALDCLLERFLEFLMHHIHVASFISLADCLLLEGLLKMLICDLALGKKLLCEKH